MSEKQRDFPELENNQVLLRTIDDEIVICLVIGCCLDVGITIVGLKDKEEWLCLNASNANAKLPSHTLKSYEEQFYETVAGIRAGLVDRFKYAKVYEDNPYSTGRLSCAFR